MQAKNGGLFYGRKVKDKRNKHLSDNKLVSSDSQSKWLENVKERRESFKKMLKEKK